MSTDTAEQSATFPATITAAAQFLIQKGYKRLDMPELVPATSQLFGKGQRFVELGFYVVEGHVSGRWYEVRIWSCYEGIDDFDCSTARTVRSFLFTGTASEMKTVVKRLLC